MAQQRQSNLAVKIRALIAWAILVYANPMNATAMPRAAASCVPVEGLAETLASRPARFVVFGELHGTLEIPQFFGDVVCQLSEKKPVVVALEFVREDGEAIQQFIHSKTKSDKSFLRRGNWAAESQDGRTSLAMFSLVGRLRQLVQAGHSVEVVGIIPSENDDLPQNYYELGIANELRRAASAHPSETVILLIGNVHAGKNVLTQFQGLRPAVSLLPPDDVVALHNDGLKGTAWQCKADTCGVHEVGGLGTAGARGIVIDSTRYEGFDGYFSIGENYTPSKPAASK